LIEGSILVIELSIMSIEPSIKWKELGNKGIELSESG
jgi:hypothetical protein